LNKFSPYVNQLKKLLFLLYLCYKFIATRKKLNCPNHIIEVSLVLRSKRSTSMRITFVWR